jgi:hypothetical protein
MAAERAMIISDTFKEIIRLRQEISLKMGVIKALVEADKHPDHPAQQVINLMLAHELAFHREFTGHQSAWHNVAFARGFFDIEEGPKKLSKSDQ